jgi:hypothetical protein
VLVCGHLYYRFASEDPGDGSRFVKAVSEGPHSIAVDVALLARAAGYSVFLTGAVGDDSRGRAVVDWLHRCDISTRFVVVGGVPRTPVAFVIRGDSITAWCSRACGTRYFARDIVDYHRMCAATISVVESGDTSFDGLSDRLSCSDIPEFRVALGAPVMDIDDHGAITVVQKCGGREREIHHDGTMHSAVQTMLVELDASRPILPSLDTAAAKET